MRYDEVTDGIFLSRPNRFIAHVDVGGADTVCHVKNTGRCRELLIPGTRVVLAHSDSPKRKTAYDLVAVWKGNRLINIDLQAPNAVVKESFGDIMDYDVLEPEHTVGDSRFDFYARRGNRRILAEVKGVTLERDGRMYFPDAPTERGLKHVRELASLAGEYECWVIFLIQTGDVLSFSPEDRIMPEFGEALRKAEEAGVRVVAYDTRVTPGSVTLGKRVEVVYS